MTKTQLVLVKKNKNKKKEAAFSKALILSKGYK